jgi:hypothetical protein
LMLFKEKMSIGYEYFYIDSPGNRIKVIACRPAGKRRGL